MRFCSSLKCGKNLNLELFVTPKHSNPTKQSLEEPSSDGDYDIVENSDKSSKKDSYSSDLAPVPTGKTKIPPESTGFRQK